MQNIIKNREYLNSFGRTKSRPFSKLLQDAFDNHLHKYLITNDNLKEFIKANKGRQIYIEIGFGTAEHLIHLAKNNPDKIIIGCEVFLNGVAKATSEIIKHKLQNLYLFKNDCRELLVELPESFIDRIYILFPDPWPKRRHANRRIINEHTLKLLEKIMKKNSILRFASDDINYYTKSVELLNSKKYFKEIFNSIKEYKIPEDHLKTKYQRIADKAGRVSNFYEGIRI